MVDGRWSMGEEGDLQTSTSIPGGGGGGKPGKPIKQKIYQSKFEQEIYKGILFLN